MPTTTSERLLSLGLERHTAEEAAQLPMANDLADLLEALETLDSETLAKLAAAAEALWAPDGLNSLASAYFQAITYASIAGGRYGYRHVGGYCMPNAVSDRARHAAEDIWWIAAVSDLVGQHNLTARVLRGLLNYYAPLPESLAAVFARLLPE